MIGRITRQQLSASLKERKFGSLYLLLGSEVFLRDEAAQRIADRALEGTFLRDFNESRFSLHTASVHDALKAAKESVALANGVQLSMIPERKVVHIKDFDKLRERDEESLIEYLENPRDSTILIFIAVTLDKRKKLSKSMLERCTVIDFDVATELEALKWANDYVERLKLSADNSTLKNLIRLTGTSIQTLQRELDKLAAAAIGTQQITMELVDQLIGRSRELSNFDLGDQLIAGDRKRALETLHRLLEDDVAPVMLVGLIAGNYHRLALAKELLKRGARDEVYRLIYGPPAKRDAFMNTLQRSDSTKIARGIQLIAAADLAIKTSLAGGGPKGARLQLEVLVCELAG
jgi:DNA polymerase-3 subunit delta